MEGDTRFSMQEFEFESLYIGATAPAVGGRKGGCRCLNIANNFEKKLGTIAKMLI